MLGYERLCLALTTQFDTDDGKIGIERKAHRLWVYAGLHKKTKKYYNKDKVQYRKRM